MSELLNRPAPPEERGLDVLAQALDDALAAAGALDQGGRRVVESVKAALEDLHRAMLVPVIRTLRADDRGRELLFELVDDPRVRMVLLMHGLIRPDPATQARDALESVRPQLQSHGGDVELVRVEDGVAQVRLFGACNGCSMSAVTMRNGVEEALTSAVPGITAVEVLPNEPGPALIPLADVGLRRVAADWPQPGWAEAGPTTDFESGTLALRVLTAGTASREAIVVNLGGQLTAYVNACPHLGNSLEDAELDPVAGTLTCDWHGYCFDALTGECRTLPGAQLAQLPLRVESGIVWVRVE